MFSALKSVFLIVMMLGCLFGIGYFKAYQKHAPWLMRLIGRKDLIDPNYYGPDYELLPNGKFRYIGDDDEDE